ncbi:MAG TPA: hypothetical protein PK322_09215 [Opitutaceae bacterium]|nr:hypothetical protein [Opitutaceae bacterium]
MATLYELQIPVETKDLAPALDQFLRLWAMADTTPTTKVQLLVITSHPEPIRMIASALPPDQRGFAPLINRHSVNLTAVEAMETLDPGTDFTFSGTIVPPLRSAELATLLAKLRELKAGPSRRTAITITASGFRWKGSNASATGDLRLMDLKAFHRKTRFTLSVSTNAGETSELAAIRAATGLAFSTPKSTDTYPELGEPSCTLEERSDACLRFDHCVETASRALRASGFDWTSLTGANANHEGASRRFDALAGPAPAPFNWQSRLTKFLQEAFPSLRKRNGIFRDAHAYFAALDEHWSWALVFDTHPGFRLGKVFKIRIGLVATGGPIFPFRRSAPLLRCAGGSYREWDDTCPEFAFSTELEFEAILASMRPFLTAKLPLFVEQLSRSFAPGGSMPAPTLPINGPLTGREACSLAQQILRDNKHDPQHLHSARLVDVIDGLYYRTDPAAQVPADGRLNSAFAWVLEYRDEDRTLEITVPYAGSARYAERSTANNSIPPIPKPQALPDEWIDSATIAPRFHQAACALQSRYPEMQATVGLLTLKVDSGRMVWTAHIEFSSSRGWVLITHTINALDGHTISTTCDERLSDRPQTRHVESITLPEQ